MLLLTILYNRMMDSGETAQAAPKGKRRTLRQKNRILDETLESDSTDEAKSFRYKDRAHEHYLFVRFFDIRVMDTGHVCIRASFKKARGTNREVVWFRRRKQGIWMCL